MGAADRSGLGLGTFAQQHQRYLKESAAHPSLEPTLYLIWFGLNDLVTNGRDKTKMKAVAVEICTLCEELFHRSANSYFIIANIPNPQGAVRFMGRELTEMVCDYQAGSFEFGFELARQVAIFPAQRATLIDLYTPVEHINDNLAAYGLTKGAQPHGVRVRYGGEQGPAGLQFTATSDEAHPTEAVYRLIAQMWAGEILQRFELGNLRNSGNGHFDVL